MAFNGKVAMVTGGASGMGQVFAARLAATGAHVAVLDLNAEGMRKTAEGRENIHVYLCDVRDNDALTVILNDVESQYGPIDRVVHAAAIMPSCKVIEDTPENIKRVMEVNYFGTVNVMMATLPKMVQRGSGDFIAFGSAAGIVPMPFFGAYGATKAAINMLVETAYYENRGRGVRIFYAAPQAVDTPLLDQSLNNKAVQDMRKNGQAMSPEAVVDAIETALEKGKFTTYGDRLGSLAVLVRRLAPGFMWKVTLKMNDL